MTLAAAGRAQTMDFTASRTEFTFWCMWSSPLLIDTDLRNLTAEKRSIIANAEAIAIDQDGGFGAADRLSNASSGAQVACARPPAPPPSYAAASPMTPHLFLSDPHHFALDPPPLVR